MGYTVTLNPLEAALFRRLPKSVPLRSGERWRKGCVNVEMVMTTSRK